MAVEPFLSGILNHLPLIGPVALAYFSLITVVALAAVFSSKPSRRKAALQVLTLLLPGRRGRIESGSPSRRVTRSRRRRRSLPPPNP